MSFREIQLRFMKVILKFAMERYDVVTEEANELIVAIDEEIMELKFS